MVEWFCLEEYSPKSLPPSGEVSKWSVSEILTIGDKMQCETKQSFIVPYRLDFHFIPSTHFPRRRKRRSFQKISIEREGKSEALSSKKVLLLLSFAMSEQKTSIVTFYNLFSVIALTILLIYAILRQKELLVLRRI